MINTQAKVSYFISKVTFILSLSVVNFTGFNTDIIKVGRSCE